MDYIADILLIAAAVGAGVYCYVLSRRLSRFTDLENGVGGAVTVLSHQVEELTKTLGAARESGEASAAKLSEMTERAEAASKSLELMIAATQDVQVDAPPTPKPIPDQPVFAAKPRAVGD